MNKFINKTLQGLPADKLCELIKHLINKNSSICSEIMEWLRENEIVPDADKKKDSLELNDKLIMEYWGKAKKIIREFNIYGGALYDEEYAGNEWIEKIIDVVEAEEISSTIKYKLMDSVFIEYVEHNSGFDDSLMDLCFSICKTKSEWEYLVKKLKEDPSDWNNKLIMDIYKNQLKNDDSYLELRRKNLYYGMDYWDLVQYYVKKNDKNTGLNIAEEGILKGEGRLDEVFDFLFDNYKKEKDTKNLVRIVDIAINREVYVENMLNRLFEYYKEENDYKKAKEVLLKTVRYTSEEENLYDKYNQLKSFIVEEEWKHIEPNIFEEIFAKDIYSYLRICIDKGMKKTVLDTIMNPPRNKWEFIVNNGFDELAEKLKKDYPVEIAEYFVNRANKYIENGKRKYYKIAFLHLKKVKEIYIEILKDEREWEQKLFQIKTKNKKRSAFLDEIKNL